jgi:hypothetical protein
MRSSVSWQFLAWNSLHFSEQEYTDKFQKKVFCFFSGHFEPVIEPTNADASDTQLA